MAFHVYPDPQTAPLVVTPGGTVFTGITQFAGISVPAGVYNKMMFIRVASSGSTVPPTLLVRAGTGTPVEARPTPTTLARGPDPAGDYVGDVVLLGEADNVQQLRVGFVADTSESWQLGIKNNDTANIEVTWVVADSIPDTAQPWISVATGVLSYIALVNEVVPLNVKVSNKGTGPLTLPAPGPVMPAEFAITSTLPLTIAPSRSEMLQITFTAPATPPQPNGSGSAKVTLVANPPDTTAKIGSGHNQQVNLSTTTQRLEVVLLLDSSGSMGTDPLGGFTADKALTRWGELTSAANHFLDILAHFGEGRGRFGIARFPATDPLNPATYDIVPMRAIPGFTGMAAAQNLISMITPTGGTPMGDGLARVLSSTTSYFSNDPFDLKVNRRWLILFSDGAQNSGTHLPIEFIAPPNGTAAPGSSLADLKVHLFAVAYGIDGHTDVEHGLMKTLAAGSFGGGHARNVDDEGVTATQVAAALRDTLKAGLTPTSAPRDPAGFHPGHGEIRHEAVITPYDGRAVFVLTWNTPDPSRMRLSLLTPAGETISPDFTLPGIELRTGDRSQVYLVDADFVRGRFGTWSLVVTGSGPENYVYDVLAETSLDLTVELDQAVHYAGNPITVSARLTGAGGPITGASVTLEVDAPTAAVANWLAAQQVPEQAMNEAKELLAGKDATPILVKQVGAGLAGLTFAGARQTFTLPMTDPDGSGVYRATVAATTVPEHYTFTVTAVGITDGVAFRREGTQQTYVLVLPKHEYSQIDINYLKSGQAQVTVYPRDEYGNVLLVDPLMVADFGLSVKGTFTLMESTLNGGYVCPVEYDPAAGLEIGFGFGGVKVIDMQRYRPPDRLHFPDRVLEYSPGIRHGRTPDAKIVLGSITRKKPDKAVSLGGGGSVSVGFADRVVLAHRDGGDVTVFVRPDTDLRPYRLDALDEPTGSWVNVGVSSGVTATFSLADSGLAETPALRVTDLSGRTRGPDNKVLRTPGVSVRGIGVLDTAVREGR
ncbi:hypothetical protein ABZ917_22370 [Nonomuraea wenchangensis]